MPLILGFWLIGFGVILLAARSWVIRHVTSKSLGSLAPGFAATRNGYLLYCYLVSDVGLFVVGLAHGSIGEMAFSAVTFVLASAIVIFGEVIVYRNLKR